MLSLAYLAFPEVNKERTDDDVAADLARGIHAFYDYASACWAMHLQTGIPNPDMEDKLPSLLETLETFIELHYSETPKCLPVSKKVQVSLFPVNGSEHYEKISQAVEWSRKQLSSHCQAPNQDEALDLWRVTGKFRSVLEKLHSRSLPEIEIQKLQQFYGRNWFKCTRISCYYYHEGFISASKKESHVNKHDRPFLCVIDGCPSNNFGLPTEQSLKKHLFDYHGIDASEDWDYPNPPKTTTPSTAKRPATFQCPLCPKMFTNNFNLQGHLRAHEGRKDFKCELCDEKLGRKSDLKRHMKGHGDGKYTCSGHLKDGSTWGCRSSFSRADKLADHFKAKTGQKCIQPLMMEKLSEGFTEENMLSGDLSANAETLLAAGKYLPSFSEFLKLCGLDKSSIIQEASNPPQ